jgi:hypothetical protein
MQRLVVALAVLAAAPLAAQTLPQDNPVLRAMWAEGMTERSQAARLAHVLMDSIGPRLNGSPGFVAAAAWIQQMYAEWGISVRREDYGTWRGWRGGRAQLTLTAPRVQNLDATILAWSPSTTGPIQAEVVAVPALADEAAGNAWLGSIRGKIVLYGVPEVTCREPQSVERLATPETYQGLGAERMRRQQAFGASVRALGGGNRVHARIEEAGAVAVFQSQWSQGWGVNKVFAANTQRVPSLDLSCEDYGLLHRMASSGWAPRVRLVAEAEDLGTVPAFNVIGEIRGRELPNEYVLLSAHLDSWAGATGATDNGTGTITMLEAMRILRATYPNPRRTILVGHWGGEEQGLIGSRAFTEDHPDIVSNLQAVFNQDNGTWRIDYIQAQGLSAAGAHLERWVGAIPTEISRHITLDLPGPQELGGSDHVSFLCHGAPGWRLQSHYPDYRQYTWHTDRDTYDKIIFDDLKNNATLAAMLAYLASEDPERVPRDRATLAVNPQTGQPRSWIACSPARRSF